MNNVRDSSATIAKGFRGPVLLSMPYREIPWFDTYACVSVSVGGPLFHV